MASLKGLDTLLGWVTKRKGGREVVRQALDALKELFLQVRAAASHVPTPCVPMRAAALHAGPAARRAAPEAL